MPLHRVPHQTFNVEDLLYTRVQNLFRRKSDL